jgi:hypothetical protein
MWKGKSGQVLQDKSGIILTSMALKRFFRDCHLRQHLDRSFQHRLKVRGYHSERGMWDPAHLCQSDRGGIRFFSLL